MSADYYTCRFCGEEIRLHGDYDSETADVCYECEKRIKFICGEKNVEE